MTDNSSSHEIFKDLVAAELNVQSMQQIYIYLKTHRRTHTNKRLYMLFWLLATRHFNDSASFNRERLVQYFNAILAGITCHTAALVTVTENIRK